MSEGSTQAVLRCPQCNKPFDKQSTLKRHGYYCRSRTSGPISRLRSCIACAKAKVRCDSKRPECSRCITKGAECRYPENKQRRNGVRAQHDNTETIEHQDVNPVGVASSPYIHGHQEISNHDILLDSTITTSNLDATIADPDFLEWDPSDINLTDFAHSDSSEDALAYQFPDLVSMPALDLSTPSTQQLQTRTNPQQISSQSLFISRFPSPSRLLVKRPRLDPTRRRIPDLIIHTLKSFPRMLMQGTLPPFIHPRLVSADLDDNAMEPLHNCISLVLMISTGLRGSRKLFWKNAKMECERIYAERLNLTRWEVLAALQALSIYIMIRLDEGETEHNNLDLLLLTTVAAMISRITCSHPTCNTSSSFCHYGRDISWENWIFEESRKRLGVIYRVINLLVYCDPSSTCSLQSSLVLAPLPAKKQLWEAPSETAWRVENANAPESRASFGLTREGNLVRLDGGWRYCSEALVHNKYVDFESGMGGGDGENWEEWCAGMDGFGGLVMLAAALLGR